MWGLLRIPSQCSRTPFPPGSVSSTPSSRLASRTPSPPPPQAEDGRRRMASEEEERRRYFESHELQLARNVHASSLQHLLDIRAHRSGWLRERTVGTAIGVRITDGRFTDVPAVLAFVPYKVNAAMVPEDQLLPRRLEGRGSMWCDLDVLEFNPSLQSEKSESTEGEVYNELVAELRGQSSLIGPGSQISSEAGFFSTMGPLVRSQRHPSTQDEQVSEGRFDDRGSGFPGGAMMGEGREEGGGGRGQGMDDERAAKGGGGRQAEEDLGNEDGDQAGDEEQDSELGFLATSRIFDGTGDRKDCMVYHPQPPLFGSGIPIAVVQRGIETATDVDWFGSFVCEDPGVTVHAEVVFAAFLPELKRRMLRHRFLGLPGHTAQMTCVDLRQRPRSVAGRKVVKVGRSTGLTYGTILGYAVEYYCPDGRPRVLDFLIQSENKDPFSLPGDVGSTVLVLDKSRGSEEEVWRPLALAWGFSGRIGRSSPSKGCPPEHWSSAVELSKV